jgi:hypothetical protein
VILMARTAIRTEPSCTADRSVGTIRPERCSGRRRREVLHMLFMVEYKLRPNMDAGDAKRLMDLFVARGASPGEVAHYVKVDGSGGVTLNELDDAIGPMMAQVANG